ncbi:MAG TPA: GH3 auxin-responsive promoter family protein, partial [Patescibacteria group bacterium]|nr:GH3 auxin-responsive promoter family protein [Patescibacteria group bacterium]
LAIGDLGRRFPNASIQRKGLLATEAVVTIPFAGHHVLAVGSHFFEFVDGDDRVHLAYDLKQGEEYELIVTTSGGLCRYRLQDRVLVTGFLERTPNLKFLGRKGNVSDRFGEKLSESFVNGVVQELIDDLPSLPRFVLIGPDETTAGIRYTLYLEGSARPEITQRLDSLLRKNPQYALCRDLGQIQAPALFLITAGGYETFAHELSKGKRLGDIKPASFSIQTGWSNRFTGYYLTCDTSTNRNVVVSI